MRNWKLVKENIESCKGVDSAEKILKILDTFYEKTKGMSKEEKLKYLEQRV